MMGKEEKSCGNLNSFRSVLPKNLSIILERGYTRRSLVPTDVPRCFPKDDEQITCIAVVRAYVVGKICF